MVKLFSIKQQYSDKIFKKKKMIEFRRQNINVSKNEICLIYTSSPVKKIEGYFIAKEKLRLPVAELWRKTKKFAGIKKNEFFKYFEGCLVGTAIIFKFVKKFAESIDLKEIKFRIKDFRPPQSYYNLNTNILNILNKLLLPEMKILRS